MHYFKCFRKNFALMLLGGIAYAIIEILWRGKTHWSMMVTGGFCFALLSNIYKKCSHMVTYQKCLLGSAVITACEFVCGMIVNVKLKLNVWDYSKLRFNIKGQVCLLYSALWALLCIPICSMCKFINKNTAVVKQDV